MKEIHDKNKFTYFTKPNDENISQNQKYRNFVIAIKKRVQFP